MLQSTGTKITTSQPGFKFSNLIRAHIIKTTQNWKLNNEFPKINQEQWKKFYF